MYCPECGQDHHAAERAEREETERAADRDVEIERLRTRRDIEVARLQAGTIKDIAEDEGSAAAAHAEGVIEGVEHVLDAANPQPGEPEAEEPEGGEPIVIDDQAVDDGDGTELPPRDERAEPEREHEPKTPERKRGFF